MPSKRKGEGKDDRPLKKGPITLEGDKQKKSSHTKPKHGVGKGLMKRKGPVTEADICRLHIYKDHVIKVIESIIKDTEMDPCEEQSMKELGALGLFDLAWVCVSSFPSLQLFLCSIVDGHSVL